MPLRESQQSTIGSREIRPSCRDLHRKERKAIEIDGREKIWSITFLADGEHVVSCGWERKIRYWRVEDGKEVRTPISAGCAVRSIAVSQDGKWVVSGTGDGRVTVWNAESGSGEKTQWKAHGKEVRAVDVSPDATKIVTGSYDSTACVWSFSTGERLLGPLRHGDHLAAVKFSPNGRLIATATQWDNSHVRVYDCDKTQSDSLLIDVPIQVDSAFNQSLAWAKDSKQLFALSSDGNINCLDVSTGTTLSKWPIHSNNYPKCIALAGNGRFIAASDESSVSFWDTATHEQIGPIIEHTATIESMAISSEYDLVTSTNQKMTLRSLCDFLPSLYCNDARRLLHMRNDGRDEKIASLENAVQQLQVQLADTKRAAYRKEDTIKSLRANLRARDANSNEKPVNLQKTVQQHRKQLAASQRAVNRKDDIIKPSHADRRTRDTNSCRTDAYPENNPQQLRTELADSQNKISSLLQILRAHEQKHQCEVLYTEGRVVDAIMSLLKFTNTMNVEVRTNEVFMDWVSSFTNRCVSALEITGDEATDAKKHNEALSAYSTALWFSPTTTSTLLVKWTSVVLIDGTVDKALSAATKFRLPRFVVYQAICDALEGDDRVMEAVESFRRMQKELAMDTSIQAERSQWELNFKHRCSEKLEKLGDAAMNSHMYNEAAGHFSMELSLDPINYMDVLIKRSRARTSMRSWEDALSDAINLDSSCHRVYQMRYAALHGAKRYSEAVEAFHTMLSKLEQSPYEHVRELRRYYTDATPTIRCIVGQTIRYMPQVLIDTATGCLYDKKQQAEAFERLPIYYELVSAMTTKLDHAWIWREVKEFYRYVMLSHKWQPNEPTFQQVENVSIYGLPTSLANDKVQRFCKLVRSLRFKWAWSDTCCVNQHDKGMQQESLVAMFRWYRGSSLTVVHLHGVSSKSQQRGDLWRSIWNTRVWTYQEYVAAEIVQFYTEDWQPYLGLTSFNHKESPSILYEMEQAMNLATHELATLRPGLDRVREKLYLASTRQTTREEDIAYSLFGIFNLPLPVIYGEGGDRAVGRLLEHVLTGSGDVTVLAWTGRAGSYNSCLPADLTVYKQLFSQQIPQPIEKAEMDNLITFPDLSLAVALHDRFNKLSPPAISSSRLGLSGLVFPLAELIHAPESDPATNLHVYRTMTSTFGDIEIKTADDLTGMNDLCLVHPWIRPLLDQEFSDGAAALDKTTQALRFVARLRQPFGALLLVPVSRAKYKRVAADSLIMVQVRQGVSLTELSEAIRTIDVQ